MATLTLRIPKGSPLTNAELDENFAQLDTLKIELGGDIGGTTAAPVVVSLRGRDLSSAAPTTGQALVWTGSAWQPQTVLSSPVSSTVTSIVTSTVTPDLSSTTTTYPAFSVYPSSSVQQTIASGSQQKVLFQNEEFDVGSCFSDSKFTPTVAGYYQLNAAVRISGTMGTGESMLVIWKNGSEYKRGWNASGTEVGANFFAMQVNALVYADGVDDYFEIYIQQGSGGGRDVTVAGGNISWFNGVYVPTEVITAVTSQAATVTSTVVTSSVAGGSAGVTVVDDISNNFNNRRKIFTLKIDRNNLVQDINYKDARDLLVIIDGRPFTPDVPQTTNLGPWIVDYEALRTYTYKMRGARLILYREPRFKTTANIRINNISSVAQTRSRYPLTPNTIVFGD